MTFGFAQEIALTQLRCAAPFALRRVCSLGERAERCGTLSSSLSSRPCVARLRRPRSSRLCDFPDRTLIEMAKRRPTSLEELASVHGVGCGQAAEIRAGFSGRDPGTARGLPPWVQNLVSLTRIRRKPDITFAAVNVVVGQQASLPPPGETPALWQLAWRKRRVSAPFYYLFCWLRSVLYRHPIFVGAADIFSFILAPLVGPVFRMIHIQLAVDDGESLRIDCIFVAVLV